jgi:DNA helicase-2/ATP-dependent DNA helicase PcrA
VSKEPYRVYKLKREPRTTGRRLDYEGSLNERQCEAVLTLEGPMLVIAGAGTGKTRTLTYRVARLLETGVPPEHIVLLTFTRRASQEMVNRVSRLLQGSTEGLVGGTFHAFGSHILRRYPPEGYPNRFSILDRGDAEDTLQLVRGERGVGRGERRFPKKRTLADILSKAVNRSMSVEEILTEEYEQFVPHTPAIVAIAEAYAAFKRKHALMDYDDLLVLLAQRLREDDPAVKLIRERFRYVLVDEYQDTNLLQAEITDLLARDHENVMVVGDDAQSIYSFRGADYRNILAFPERYPHATVVKLERNYRSTQPILDVANAVIGAAKVGFTKTLFTERGEGDRPAIVMAESDGDQAAFIAQRVIELREEGIKLQDISVLFRSAFQSYELELELGRRDIPFVKWGGFRFLEAAHIKDVLAHVRVLANPADAVSWTRLLTLLPGVGPRRAADIIERTAQSGNPFALGRLNTPPATHTALTKLERLFDQLRGPERTPTSVVAEVVSYYEPILASRFDDHPRRLRDIEHFRVLAEGFGSISSMLEEMSLDPPDRAVDNRLGTPLDEGERLVLSTIHSAKGMEWRVVFVMGAVDGYFPSLWSIGDADDLEEERRLMYVALTRARDHLFVTYPVSVFHPSSGRVLNRPSRFLEDVPKGLFERWAVSG